MLLKNVYNFVVAFEGSVFVRFCFLLWGGHFAGNWQFWQLNMNLSYFCIKAKNLIGSSLGPMILKTYCLIVSKFSQIYLISAFSPQCALTESQTNRFCGYKMFLTSGKSTS
jgi:hypothetical protein